MVANLRMDKWSSSSFRVTCHGKMCRKSEIKILAVALLCASGFFALFELNKVYVQANIHTFQCSIEEVVLLYFLKLSYLSHHSYLGPLRSLRPLKRYHNKVQSVRYKYVKHVFYTHTHTHTHIHRYRPVPEHQSKRPVQGHHLQPRHLSHASERHL